MSPLSDALNDDVLLLVLSMVVPLFSLVVLALIVVIACLWRRYTITLRIALTRTRRQQLETLARQAEREQVDLR